MFMDEILLCLTFQLKHRPQFFWVVAFFQFFLLSRNCLEVITYGFRLFVGSHLFAGILSWRTLSCFFRLIFWIFQFVVDQVFVLWIPILNTSVLWSHWLFFYSGVDKRILVWDLAEGTLLTELKGHTDTVYSMRFSRDGNMLASGRYDHSLSRAYHLRNKKKNLAELTLAMTSRTVTRDNKFGSRYPLVSKRNWKKKLYMNY